MRHINKKHNKMSIESEKDCLSEVKCNEIKGSKSFHMSLLKEETQHKPTPVTSFDTLLLDMEPYR